MKQVKCLLGGKRVQAVWTDTGDSPRVSLSWWLESLSRGTSPGFLRPVTLACLDHSSCSVYLGILSLVRTHLLAKMDFTEQHIGREHPLTDSPWPPRGFSAHEWWARSPDLEEKSVVSAGPLPSSPAILISAVQTTGWEALTALPWGPISSCLSRALLVIHFKSSLVSLSIPNSVTISSSHPSPTNHNFL